MEHITNIIAWLKANWADILALWACIVGMEAIVLKWTDHKKDAETLGKARARRENYQLAAQIRL